MNDYQEFRVSLETGPCLLLLLVFLFGHLVSWKRG